MERVGYCLRFLVRIYCWELNIGSLFFIVRIKMYFYKIRYLVKLYFDNLDILNSYLNKKIFFFKKVI